MSGDYLRFHVWMRKGGFHGCGVVLSMPDISMLFSMVKAGYITWMPAST